MRTILFFLTTLVISVNAHAQEATKPPAQVFQYVEQMPEFPGNVQEYLAKNITYPAAAQKANIEGRVYVRFVVSEDGTISDAKVTRGIGGGCDEEAVRVIMAMPKWKPGKQNGKPVKVAYTQPIIFRLEQDKNGKK